MTFYIFENMMFGGFTPVILMWWLISPYRERLAFMRCFSTAVYLFIISAIFKSARGYTTFRLIEGWALILHVCTGIVRISFNVFSFLSLDHENRITVAIQFVINGIIPAFVALQIFVCHLIVYDVSRRSSVFTSITRLVLWCIPCFSLLYGLGALYASKKETLRESPLEYALKIHNDFCYLELVMDKMWESSFDP
jgi:hypothetical protein